MSIDLELRGKAAGYSKKSRKGKKARKSEKVARTQSGQRIPKNKVVVDCHVKVWVNGTWVDNTVQTLMLKEVLQRGFIYPRSLKPILERVCEDVLSFRNGEASDPVHVWVAQWCDTFGAAFTSEMASYAPSPPAVRDVFEACFPTDMDRDAIRAHVKATETQSRAAMARIQQVLDSGQPRFSRVSVGPLYFRDLSRFDEMCTDGAPLFLPCYWLTTGM